MPMTHNEIRNYLRTVKRLNSQNPWLVEELLREQSYNIWDLNKKYKKLKRELIEYTTYPNKDLTEARTYGEKIKEICKYSEINVRFNDPKNKDIAKDYRFAQFFYKGENITPLIDSTKDNG
jgi:hypothetical protein